MKKIALIVFMITTMLVSGCATDTRTKKGSIVGAALGTAVGAGVGYAVGGKKGAAIGAGSGMVLGGLSGGAVGRYMDNQEREMRQALANAEAASIQREQEALAVSFKSDVLFDFGSAILKPGAYNELDRVARVLNRYPQTRIHIEGHTDNSGTETYNLDLSRRRADAVKNALVARGVDSSRLVTFGFGEAQPVASNKTVAGRQMNRRVKIVIAPMTA